MCVFDVENQPHEKTHICFMLYVLCFSEARQHGGVGGNAGYR